MVPWLPLWIVAYASTGAAGVRRLLHAVAHHTGVPIIVVAAAALVVSWRWAKRALRLAFEVAFVTALLLAATRLGWIRW